MLHMLPQYCPIELVTKLVVPIYAVPRLQRRAALLIIKQKIINNFGFLYIYVLSFFILFLVLILIYTNKN